MDNLQDTLAHMRYVQHEAEAVLRAVPETPDTRPLLAWLAQEIEDLQEARELLELRLSGITFSVMD